MCVFYTLNVYKTKEDIIMHNKGGIMPEETAFFQTAWFIESLATQTFVIYIIRTNKIPFLQSSPSRSLLFSSLFCVILGAAITYSPIGKFFGFVQLPFTILLAIAGIVIIYLVLVEIVKRIFYRFNPL
jgi:Mg2+-importing ATPase